MYILCRPKPARQSALLFISFCPLTDISIRGFMVSAICGHEVGKCHWVVAWCAVHSTATTIQFDIKEILRIVSGGCTRWLQDWRRYQRSDHPGKQANSDLCGICILNLHSRRRSGWWRFCPLDTAKTGVDPWDTTIQLCTTFIQLC